MLIPALVSAFFILLGLVAYKCRVNQVVAQLRMGAKKRAPPGGEREITLVLTDVQVGAKGSGLGGIDSGGQGYLGSYGHWGALSC